MTHNQLMYMQNLETQRANLAKERETHRSNIAAETEKHRSNVASEGNTVEANRIAEKKVDTKDQHYQRMDDTANRRLRADNIKYAISTGIDVADKAASYYLNSGGKGKVTRAIGFSIR